jgi:hypothetical protein
LGDQSYKPRYDETAWIHQIAAKLYFSSIALDQEVRLSIPRKMSVEQEEAAYTEKVQLTWLWFSAG